VSDDNIQSPFVTASAPVVDELRGAERSARRHRGGRLPSFRTLAVLLIVLALGLPISYLASWYSHRQEHQTDRRSAAQYKGYVAGFAFVRQHPMPPDAASNFDYCDAAAHRLNRTAGVWLRFWEGCEDATSWTPGDPPLRPLSKADFLAPPR
jgi:hypothetical protein